VDPLGVDDTFFCIKGSRIRMEDMFLDPQHSNNKQKT
jgi:hypothetical protein